MGGPRPPLWFGAYSARIGLQTDPAIPALTMVRESVSHHGAPYENMSAQMLRAHAIAKSPSIVLGPGERPPLPFTTTSVFCAGS